MGIGTKVNDGAKEPLRAIGLIARVAPNVWPARDNQWLPAGCAFPSVGDPNAVGATSATKENPRLQNCFLLGARIPEHI
jgi:hypothetical protein